jgi:hypothetical protein
LLIVAQASMAHVAGAVPGKAVGAPHDGFDLGSGSVARLLADELGWGIAVASEYRSTAARRWLDVNRPTERRWISGGFSQNRVETTRARDVYEDYQRRLLEAAGQSSGRLDLLVEVHTHARVVEVHGVRVQLQAIEVATRGFSDAQLRRMKERYADLVSQLPAQYRIPLAFDRIDERYRYRGDWIRYFFGASGAKRTGSMRSTKARRALHFECPPLLVAYAQLQRVYARILARVIESAEAATQPTGGMTAAVGGS